MLRWDGFGATKRLNEIVIQDSKDTKLKVRWIGIFSGICESGISSHCYWTSWDSLRLVYCQTKIG
jgi:hypothetical protein